MISIISSPLEHLRGALRGLRRAPGFAVTATLTLALGIGLSTAVFTIAGAILIGRLPVADQDRLVLLWGETHALPNVPLTLDDIRAMERSFTTLDEAAYLPFRGAVTVPIRHGDRVHPVQLGMVSGNFFAVLGARPALGRVLRAEDDLAGAHPVVVLGHRAWQQRFGADSGVIGRTITTVENGMVHTIVGVMPPGLEYPRGTDLWVPLTAYSSAGGFHDILVRELDVLARLRASASPGQARAELARYFERDGASSWHRDARATVRPLSAEVLGDTRPAVILIGLVATLLLCISCVNVANLLLVRAMARARELVVRAALGAGRARLLGQSVAESGILAIAGGAIGAALAVAAVRTFVALAPATVARLEEVAVDRDMLLVAIGVTILAMLVSGAGPALFASRIDGAQVLRSGSRSTGSPRLRRVLEGLVAAQIALAVVSLIAAGLMTRSLYRLTHADLAFESNGLLAAPLAIATPELPDATRIRAALDLVQQGLRAAPGVTSVALTYSAPFIGGGGGIDGRLSAPGRSGDEPASTLMVNLEIAAPRYFETLGTPVVRGRAFTADDREGSPPVVIISSSVARHFWPDQEPIGKRLVGAGGREATVVGVVPDMRYRDLHTARASAYFPLDQSPFGELLPSTLLIRVTGSPAALASRLRGMIEEAGPGLAMVSVAPVDALLDGPRARARLNTMVLALFGAAALSLAALGLFVVIATTVRQRARELGIRMALGATADDIGKLVVRRGLLLTAIGGVAGLGVSLAAGRLLSSLLFDTGATDIATLLAVAAVMLVVALFASLWPARTSTRIDPVVALRSEA